MRYDKRTDKLKMIIGDGEASSSKELDEDVTISYTRTGDVAVISVANALTRIFDGLGVKLPSERQVATEEHEGGWKVDVDADKCLGFGSCVIVSPEIFRLDERPGQGVFRSTAKLDVLDETGGRDFDRLRMAAQSCPTQAISIIDRKSGRRIYPPE